VVGADLPAGVERPRDARRQEQDVHGPTSRAPTARARSPGGPRRAAGAA
jgi:hypothetical protein